MLELCFDELGLIEVLVYFGLMFPEKKDW